MDLPSFFPHPSSPLGENAGDANESGQFGCKAVSMAQTSSVHDLGSRGAVLACISIGPEPWLESPALITHLCSSVPRANLFSEAQRYSQETRIGTWGQLQKARLRHCCY